MEDKKLQIFYIHGGMTLQGKEDYINFLKTREIKIEKRIKWSDEYLDKNLGEKFQIIKPRMPLQDYAQYEEWKIHFERHFPYLDDNIILIGESLGGIFLAKYLSENKFPKKILATYLVCPPFDNTLPDEELVGGFELKSDLSLLQENSKKLNFLFSRNDDVVPMSHVEKYRNKLKDANVVIYDNIEGHFSVSEFPEIIEMINEDLKSLS
ncbi:hypothetical protein CL617_01285 [archaeon]|nr:hypothetical protein [archaeon]|tara:strand:- start:5640 stop:6266 length:627 start_codon:yes stop_codon:yes gene_type:complete